MNNERKGKAFRKPISDIPRKIAFEVLTEVVRNNAYSNLLLPQRLAKSNLDIRDRAFITELVYGSIRQIGRNDYIAAKFSNRPWSEVDSGIVDSVRLGAYQIFDMRVPAHAAVSATVDMARLAIGESKASFVNAILRRLSERSLTEHLKDLEENTVAGLSIRYSHPEWIINAYRDSLSSLLEVEELLKTNNQPVTPTLVAWPGKSTQNDFCSLGFEATKYSKFGAICTAIPGDLDLIRERKAGIQDEGSQLVAAIFAQVAREKEPWLDLCAGPGGKAALLSHLAEGAFFANEISEARADLVSQVVSNKTKVIVGDGREIAKNLPHPEGQEPIVNAILADVPCTGIGALRRRPEVRWRRTPDDLPRLTNLQMELAKSAIDFLQSGGIFGYATCSPHIAETVMVCSQIERKLPVEKIDLKPFLPVGLADATKDGFLQLWPHRHGTDAMFLAMYRKR